MDRNASKFYQAGRKKVSKLKKECPHAVAMLEAAGESMEPMGLSDMVKHSEAYAGAHQMRLAVSLRKKEREDQVSELRRKYADIL
jgi:hypothetical protein